jgi:hypothetical protein
MVPIQMVVVGIGGETIHVPVFQLAYLGGRDGFTERGGFFVTESGEYGIAVDARVPVEQIPAFADAQVRANVGRLQALIASQLEALGGAQPGALTTRVSA